MAEWEKMLEGARKMVRVLTDVKAGEEVLIITDPTISLRISQAVAEAAAEQGATPLILIKPVAKASAEEPGKVVAVAMKTADVLFGFLKSSLMHTQARRDACKVGARMLSCTGIVEDTLVRGPIEADFEHIYPVVQKMAQILTEGKHVRVTAPGGTDFTTSIEGRRGGEDIWSRTPGIASGGPSVEVNIGPLEGTTNGRLVVDGSGTGIGLIEESIVITLQNGTATSIEGGAEAQKLREMLEKAGSPNSYNVGELGIGLNPMGRLTGNIMEDESTYGTCHVALGNNVSYGGKNPAPTHLDLIIRQPTIEVDGQVVVREGTQLVMEDVKM
jgi:leucyl aminopeptidase (aminopeptidase T)